MTKKQLGKQIKALRKQCGVSTYKLEKKGVHPSLPSTIENGVKGYSIDTLIRYLTAISADIQISVVQTPACDVCGSRDVIEAPHMGRNCNDCNPLY
jgi:transcriptional regulator with XRE-family HTH domain